jgi:hypothetical protein
MEIDAHSLDAGTSTEIPKIDKRTNLGALDQKASGPARRMPANR